MFFKQVRRSILFVYIISLLVTNRVGASEPKHVNIGYFEAGPYPVHSVLRSEFYNQLDLLLPGDLRYTTIANGFRSAEWNRDSCRAMAVQLAQEKDLDLVIAMGPWVVEDLLAAGFKKPIVAVHQFDPKLEGLLDDKARPIAANLTVHQVPNRIASDLNIFSRLVNIKRLGFLYFPSADESGKVLAEVQAIAKELGFEVVTAEGFDNNGTYAFFKAFGALDTGVDAIYLPPLWGLDLIKTKEFLSLLADHKKPSFSSEGKALLDRGAFATNSMYAGLSEARFAALKTIRIMQGEKPADLPVIYSGGYGLAVNQRTARKCDIALPEDVLNDFYVVWAPPADDAPYYSLNDAVYRAESQNPGYLARYQAIDAAVEAAGQVSAQYRPQVYGTAELGYLDDNAVNNSRDWLKNDQFTAGLHLEQTLLSMETIKAIQAQAKKRDLEQANLKQAQLDLELSVTLAYLDYLEAKEKLAACEGNRNLIDHNLEIATARNQLEKGDTLDVLRLQSERYRATVRMAEVRRQLRVARVFLNALLNLPGDDVFVLDSISFCEEIFWGSEGQVLSHIKDEPAINKLQNSLVNQALSKNPRMDKYRLQIDLQHSLLAQNRARYYPSLGFRASLNYEDRQQNTLLFEEKSTTWTVLGFLKLPIYLGGDRAHEKNKLKARLSEIEYEKDAVSLDIMKEIQNGLYTLAAQAGMMTPTYQSRRLANSSLDLVVRKYVANALPLLNVLDAQTDAREADLAAMKARYDYYRAAARLVYSAGWIVGDDYSNFLDEFHRRLQN